MAKKTIKTSSFTISQIILLLVVVECAASLFCIFTLQKQLDDYALSERVHFLQTAHPQVYCPEQKMTIDNQEKLQYAK